MNKCPHCGKRHKRGTKKCPETGKRIWGENAKLYIYIAAGLAVIVIAAVVIGVVSNKKAGELTADTAQDGSALDLPAGGDDTPALVEDLTTQDPYDFEVVIDDSGEGIAWVDDETIEIGDFQKRVYLERDQLVNQYYQYYSFAVDETTDPSIAQQYLYILVQIEQDLLPEITGESVLTQMVSEILILREAKAQGVVVSEEEVDDYIRELFGIPEGAVVDESENWTNLLNNFSHYQLDGAFFRGIIRTQMYTERLSELLQEDVAATEEQVWARHILVEAEETANDILEQLEEGASWETLASENSIDTSNKDQGGDLGWFGRGMMVSEFEEAAFSGEVGEIVGPVETSFGFHLIEIIEKGEQPVSPEKLTSLVNEALLAMIEEDKADAEIVYADNWMDWTPLEPSIPERGE